MSRKELERQDMANSYYIELGVAFVLIQLIFG